MTVAAHAHKRDFAVDGRLLRVAALALVVGAVSTIAARILLDLIRLFTNLFFFQTLSPANRSPAEHHLDGRLLGLVDREFLRCQADASMPLADALGAREPAVAYTHETCRVVAARLSRLGLAQLAVVDDAQHRRLIGIVSRSDLVEPARSFDEEELVRERMIDVRMPRSGTS